MTWKRGTSHGRSYYFREGLPGIVERSEDPRPYAPWVGILGRQVIPFDTLREAKEWLEQSHGKAADDASERAP